MAKLDARSVVIILASFGLVAGTLILVQKRNGPPEAPAASAAQAMIAPPSAPIELLGSSPAPSPVTAPAPAPVAAPTPSPAPAPVSSTAQPAIPAEASAPAPASSTKPVQVASSAKPASVAATKPASAASAATHHAIPAESESTPVSAAKPAASSVAKPTAASAVKPTSAAAAPVKPATAPVKSAPKPPAALTGKYFLQAGAFKDENNARKLIAKLKTAGFAASESTVGELHKVLVGPFPSSDAATAAKTKLKAQGFDSAFVAKK